MSKGVISVGSFGEELASLRGFVIVATDNELAERTFFYFEYLEKLRLIIRELDSCVNSGQLSSDLANEQRWCVLLDVCEVELARRGCSFERF